MSDSHDSFGYQETRVSAGVPASNLEYLHRCPICGDSQLRHYVRVASLFNEGEFIRYERCAECRTVLRNPRLPAEYRHLRYEEPAVPAEAKQLEPKNQVHYAYMIKQLERLFNYDLLHIGGGNAKHLKFKLPPRVLFRSKPTKTEG